MSRMHKGIAVAVIHVLLVCSLGAKLLIDRHRYPRVWVKTASYDPDLPIRGRYVSLQLDARAEGFSAQPQELEWQKQNKMWWNGFYRTAKLEVRNGQLWVRPGDGPNAQRILFDSADFSTARLAEPVLFFIPEHAQDPSRRPRGEELWAEVTVPKKGPPRPIQLAVKDAQGGWHPLDLR
jgi:hypothetical protein